MHVVAELNSETTILCCSSVQRVAACCSILQYVAVKIDLETASLCSSMQGVWVCIHRKGALQTGPMTERKNMGGEDP
jgi:hypothetical protein